MNISEELFRQLSAGVSFERPQGLDVEVVHRLPDGWIKEAVPDGYIFTSALSQQAEDEMWRMIRFLTYKSLFALRRIDLEDRRDYEVVSCMESGSGFRLIFRFVSSTA